MMVRVKASRKFYAPKRPGAYQSQPKSKPKPPRQPQASTPRARPKPKKMNMGFPTSHANMRDQERLITLTIPADSAPGTLLHKIVVNPTQIPDLSTTATRFDTWRGRMTLEAETTGNAFSKNYVIIRHLRDGDPSKIPVQAQALLNTAETGAGSRRLQLDSNSKILVEAPWKLSPTKVKPMTDADANDTNNGVFIIVSNGSPGSESVDVVLRMHYDVQFSGRIIKPVIKDTSSELYSETGTLTRPWSGSSFSGPGINYLQWDDSSDTLTLPAGKYLFSLRITGTGMTALAAASLTNCTQGAAATQLTTTFISRVYTVSVPISGTIRLDQPLTGSTITGASLFIAPFNA